mmetsp:Transcript_690/g.2015  ORF Transcript_690/g.2015 Transcript_690/m.2015 type:complete len:397 (+) Transcript_690:51-1241(+)
MVMMVMMVPSTSGIWGLIERGARQPRQQSRGLLAPWRDLRGVRLRFDDVHAEAVLEVPGHDVGRDVQRVRRREQVARHGLALLDERAHEVLGRRQGAGRRRAAGVEALDFARVRGLHEPRGRLLGVARGGGRREAQGRAPLEGRLVGRDHEVGRDLGGARGRRPEVVLGRAAAALLDAHGEEPGEVRDTDGLEAQGDHDHRPGAGQVQDADRVRGGHELRHELAEREHDERAGQARVDERDVDPVGHVVAEGELGVGRDLRDEEDDEHDEELAADEEPLDVEAVVGRRELQVARAAGVALLEGLGGRALEREDGDLEALEVAEERQHAHEDDVEHDGVARQGCVPSANAERDEREAPKGNNEAHNVLSDVHSVVAVVVARIGSWRHDCRLVGGRAG